MQPASHQWRPRLPNPVKLVEALPGIQIIDRSSVNIWDDAAAIEATGRRNLVVRLRQPARALPYRPSY
jgi:hypothetical protein